MNCLKYVCINEVGFCDGLQNELVWVDIEDKIEWINMLLKIGFFYIEVILFVYLRWILVFCDSLDVVKGIVRLEDMVYVVFVLNFIGLEYAVEGRID